MSRRSRTTRTITVQVPRLSGVNRVGNQTLRYKPPNQRQAHTRYLRSLPVHHVPRRLQLESVAIRIPRKLPRAMPSYWFIDRRNRLTIAPRRATNRLLLGEAHRPRYDERKTRRRKARHGQVDSMRILGQRTRLAIAAGLGPNAIADAAMIDRAEGMF